MEESTVQINPTLGASAQSTERDNSIVRPVVNLAWEVKAPRPRPVRATASGEWRMATGSSRDGRSASSTAAVCKMPPRLDRTEWLAAQSSAGGRLRRRCPRPPSSFLKKQRRNGTTQRSSTRPRARGVGVDEEMCAADSRESG